MRIDSLPILGICGWSGSGKTTLIEQVAPKLAKDGLKVAVVKHDAHGIDVDRPGKDSDRLYRAGADVLLQGPGQEFCRTHRTDDVDLAVTLAGLADRYDLVLVEGHKGTPLPKVWLLGDDESAPPADIKGVAAILSRDADRVAAVLALLDSFLAEQWLKTPVFGCALIGGKSSRMGAPKHLLREDGRTWLERTAELLGRVCKSVVIAGGGDVPEGAACYPRLVDVPDAKGPMSGILAAMRWAPHTSWLVAACDLPGLTAEALDWLLSTRRPGVWATVPRLKDAPTVEPLLAHYDFRCRPLLQRQADGGNFRLADVASHPKVITPIAPDHLQAAWRNANAPEDLEPGDCDPLAPGPA